MPNKDGTGPMGQGPKTGKGFGPCCMNMPFFGRGFGRGRKRGFGRFMNWPADDKAQKQMLEDYKKALQEELEDADKELANLDS